MPATRPERARVLLRASLPWRRLFGNRTVRRNVQGVEMYLPWSHLLPDYARARPTYGQNLVELAAAVAERTEAPLQVVDIGANVGDSALQILARVDGRVLCIEGDPYWMDYLHRNVDGNARVTVEETLLAEPDAELDLKAVRTGGTTKFVAGSTSVASRSAAEVRDRHPDFDRVRLIKCDVDGFDPVLIVEAAAAWQASAPVLFFEFDPKLAREVSPRDPNDVWDALAALGYSELAIWDNTGDALGRLPIDAAAAKAERLEPPPVDLGYHFWDVAACRGDDDAGIAAFDALMPAPFDERGLVSR